MALRRVVFLPAVALQVAVAPVAALLLVEMQPQEGQRVRVAARQPVARQPQVVGRVPPERPRPAAPGHLAELRTQAERRLAAARRAQAERPQLAAQLEQPALPIGGLQIPPASLAPI